VPIAVTVGSIQDTSGLLHLGDCLLSTGIEGLANDRLFGTLFPPKSQLDRAITADQLVGPDQPVPARQDRDQPIGHFLKRVILDRLLIDPDILADRFDDLPLLTFSPSATKGAWLLK